ncbi:FO synthase subunit 2 [[Leptolyngbya] sp. PCC 7376]|uniref:7,8-didemethyl-8-hydroxy-5-deazariboflavin synthase subunit CofH n=1 Tax=[Leptolyngbya] sp. PCC 7376 TaxID=111781 RepID=UPI00029F449B|nr:7,8-didemethyl-8-hydroxy-5-deazariboflavin synthase subunit CofH [[Leptolyngbya] sp. PCC 7376]AFY38403.1 FO synthase subunit 2 [[Leptolyngbya] sp. PCC 7376]
MKLTEILDKAIALQDLSVAEGIFLLEQYQPDAIEEIRQAADELRRSLCGETVTYVVNRNLNFTNICEQHCHFCAFRRDADDEGAFWLDNGQLLEKAADAVQRGATEICMQGGLNPEAKINGRSLDYYLDLVRSLKTEFPQLHIHAFSPQEIEFIARQDELTFAEVILALKDVGVGSFPGTAAEVLDDQIRRQICPEKLDTATWLEIVSLAHSLGIMTTSTMLCGHIETLEQQVCHLEQMRSLQQYAVEKNYSAKISEFILLPFVGQDAPAVLRKKVGRDQPDLNLTLHLTAVSRLFLGKWIVNHQPSWVKLGLDGATEALRWGCNDIGGTLMEEHITTMAGAQGGTCLTIEQLQHAIASQNRPSAERTTLYHFAIATETLTDEKLPIMMS